MRTVHLLLCIVVTTVGAVLLDATVAFARAGGGGGYSSGGSSSSSSYGGGSSSSSYSGGSGEATIVDLIFLSAMIAGAIYFNHQMKKRRRVIARERATRAAELAFLIRTRDPDFDVDAFTERVSSAFHAIQAAWSKQDLRDVRGFMSDGLHERFSIQLREQKALGYRNQLSQVRIRECVLVDAQALAEFDVVSMRIHASAIDVRVDARNGKEISDTRLANSFTEVWTFLRGRPEARATDDPRPESGLFEGQCPNCAAPIDPERAWSCGSCGSDLDSAPPDWVLVEITQLSEWKATDREEPAWLKDAIQRDPGLTRQQLEDRASVLFWRLMDAERTGRVDELASVARTAFLADRRQRIEAAGHRYLGDCAVGAVILRGILPGAEWDLALVEVRWAGGSFRRVAGGPPESTGGRSLRRSLLVMARRADARSTLGRCIVSAHCHRCGAPDEGALQGGCSFCGEPLNDGTDWLIDRFPHLIDRDAMALLAELDRPRLANSAAPDPDPEPERVSAPFEPGGTDLYCWSLKLAYADSDFDKRERERLLRLADRLGIPRSEARKLRQAAQFGRLEIELPADAEQARGWARELRAMAEADGRLTRHERAVLEMLEGHAQP